jgi:carboxymethylenebutenolidase
MKRAFFIAQALIALLSFAVAVAAQSINDHMNHAGGVVSPGESEIEQDWAKQATQKSSRHREWVTVKNGDRNVSSFVVYPETNKKATAVIVIHEIFGMSDWVQELADELAAAGYIAIAPDLLSGMGPHGGGTSDVATVGATAIGLAIRDLKPNQITGDLNAVADYVSKLPAANGKVVVGGFCWGGTQTFLYATNNPKLKAAFVFYGSAPMTGEGANQMIDKPALARINAPVYGFYAGNDMRINATLPATIPAMKELKKDYDPATYAGAGHGFMRAGDAPPPAPPELKGDAEADKSAKEAYEKTLTNYKANKKARDEAWERWKKILAKI